MARIRSIAHIIGLPKTEKRLREKRGRIRSKVPCYCNKCNGKLVLNRTKTLHEAENTNDLNLSSNLVNASS